MPVHNDFETVAASQTAQRIGPNGNIGNILERIIIVPTSTSPGAVDIADGNGTNIRIFNGGSSSLSELKPIVVELGMICVNTTTPGWEVTTGANVAVIAIGRFT
jgi:hypothetical protein